MDYALESTFDHKFTSRAFATGIPTAIASGTVVIYEDNSTTEITAAETLTVSFDGIVGYNNLRVVATAANGFEAGKSYSAVLSVGTVGGVSVVGETVHSWTMERSSAVMPTTAGRTLDVTATGTAGIDWGNIENKDAANDLSATDIQLADTVTDITNSVSVNGLTLITTTIATLASQTSFTLAAGSADNSAYINQNIIVIDASTSAQISVSSVNNYVGGSKTITLPKDEGIFTLAVGDTVVILASSTIATANAILQGNTFNVNNSWARRIRQLGGIILDSGILQAGSVTGGTLQASAIPSINKFVDEKIIITSGTAAGETGIITVTATDDTFSITPPWRVQPDNTSEYEIIPSRVHATVVNGTYGGFIHVDATGGTAGQIKGVNGVDTRKCLNLTDAYVIGGFENIESFKISASGTTLTLPSDSSNKTFTGAGYVLAFGNVDISNAQFTGAVVLSGTAIGSIPAFFQLCSFDSPTLNPFGTNQCAFAGEVIIGAAGNTNIGGSAGIDGSIPSFALPNSASPSKISFTDWRNKVLVKNMGLGGGAATIDITGSAHLILDVSDTAGTVNLFAPATIDLGASGSITVNYFSEVGKDGASLTDLGGMSTGMKNEVAQAVWNAQTSAHNVIGSYGVALEAILVDTSTTIPALIDGLNDISASDVWTFQLTESYAADNTAFTGAQALFMLWSVTHEFSIAGVTVTSKKLNSTSAMTHTLDDAINPTSRERAT